jgi:pimeloyl-ACP methyl ester carboxylesterase
MIEFIEGSGPLLVYIPGLDGTGKLFFKQIPGLVCRYRVAALRLRDGRDFTYEDLTDDVAAAIRSLSEERATIVGESFGGTVALYFALRHPQMTEQLVVINSFPRFRNRLKINLAICSASALPFDLLWPARRAAVMLGLLVDRVSHEDRCRAMAALREVKRDGYLRRLELIREVNLEPKLSEIRAPTLLIAGTRDLLIRSAREARAMAARMPNARIHIVPKAGHACLLGSRVRLAELLQNL